MELFRLWSYPYFITINLFIQTYNQSSFALHLYNNKACYKHSRLINVFEKILLIVSYLFLFTTSLILQYFFN